MIDDLDTLADHNPANDPRDRRREPRIEYSQPCTFAVTAPVWALTTVPIHAMTEDITTHGVRVRVEGVDCEKVAMWASVIEDDAEVKVDLILTRIPMLPALKGQIVWMDPGNAASDPAVCSLGILFSVLKEMDRRKLQQLVASLNSGQ